MKKIVAKVGGKQDAVSFLQRRHGIFAERGTLNIGPST